MRKQLTLVLLAAALAGKAQAPHAALPTAEQSGHDRQLSSLRTLTAQIRSKTDAYNDAYMKAHPDYLRQHPEILRQHPEYRTRYAKYLQPAKASAR